MSDERRPPRPDAQSPMFYGLPGDFVRLVAPQSEADRVALLLQWLVAFGSIVGPCHYAIAESDTHYANLFAAIVGLSGNQGRKGTSFGHVREFMRQVDDTWRIRSGLVSGEGLIENVRDGNPEKNDPGVADKRLFVAEMEFARLLKVMQREGSTLSPIVRLAYDHSVLESMARQMPLRATGAHISITAHITPAELTRHLTTTDVENGFGNRFLWVYVEPSQRLPYGGTIDPDALKALVGRTQQAVAAPSRGLVPHAATTRPLWDQAYKTSLTRKRSGLAGDLTSRADAQVLRLALLYALADRATEVQPAHLAAALALWWYCEACTAYLFGDATGDPPVDRLAGALRKKSPLTREYIYATVFQRNVRKAEIERALVVLEEQGRVHRRTAALDGRGRPEELVYWGNAFNAGTP